MEDVFIIKIENEELFTIIDSENIGTYNNEYLLNVYKPPSSVNYLLIIEPFSVNKAIGLAISKHFFENTKIEGLLIFLPSTLLCFTFDTPDLFLVNVNKIGEFSCEHSNLPDDEKEKIKILQESKIEASIEIVEGTRFIRYMSIKLQGGFDEVMHDTYSHLNRCANRIKLASNMSVQSRCPLLKRMFEEKLAMQVCIGTSIYQIKYLKFLKEPIYLRDVPLVNEGTRDDQLMLGASLAIKLKFTSNGEYSKRDDFLKGDYKYLYTE
ncbi:hypothetical protein TCON_0338 [Astathelohania contejeani]|uniref:Uncharacterized protein n=1 Tax=Astathelohania contejeani TaxID=164912 RepID=A0ABQ7I223_9MICR|nr:hypothetical protein TCON_0338 [Thelohania contejeani]